MIYLIHLYQKKVNIQSSRSGDPYDGNPLASKEEQKERMKYIRSVYNKEYNDGNHDESIYTIYLYTSHYIEKYKTMIRVFSDEKKFWTSCICKYYFTK